MLEGKTRLYIIVVSRGQTLDGESGHARLLNIIETKYLNSECTVDLFQNGSGVYRVVFSFFSFFFYNNLCQEC